MVGLAVASRVIRQTECPAYNHTWKHWNLVNHFEATCCSKRKPKTSTPHQPNNMLQEKPPTDEHALLGNTRLHSVKEQTLPYQLKVIHISGVKWAIPENIHTPPPPWTTLNWVPKNFRISKNDNCSLCRIPEPADSKS